VKHAGSNPAPHYMETAKGCEKTHAPTKHSVLKKTKEIAKTHAQTRHPATWKQRKVMKKPFFITKFPLNLRFQINQIQVIIMNKHLTKIAVILLLLAPLIQSKNAAPAGALTGDDPAAATPQTAQAQKTGGLHISITAGEAECILSQNGNEHLRWQGTNLVTPLPEGTYELTVTANGCKSYRTNITVTANETTLHEVQMEPFNNSPEMVLVKGGSFKMGCTSEQADGCEANEKPEHKVTVDDFYIGKYEVTQELWESIMGSNRSDFKGAKLPADNVTWIDAVEFCNKLSEKEGLQKVYGGTDFYLNVTCDFTANGYRLPTEAEWEYAARGGSQAKGLKFSGSKTLDEVGWNRDNSDEKTHEVGKKKPNELGLYDMSGNVHEWCWDWFGDYSADDRTNPTGASADRFHVLRGGSWMSYARQCRVSYRDREKPDDRSRTVGFRLARNK